MQGGCGGESGNGAGVDAGGRTNQGDGGVGDGRGREVASSYAGGGGGQVGWVGVRRPYSAAFWSQRGSSCETDILQSTSNEDVMVEMGIHIWGLEIWWEVESASHRRTAAWLSAGHSLGLGDRS